MKKQAIKTVPKLTSDKAAAAFLANDVSQLDFARFKPVRFEFAKKDSIVNMRLPASLLNAVKAKAKARGIPYTRFIRDVLERVVNG